MRKQSLRQTANRYLKTDNRGSFKDKQHRAFVIHKMIDDLFVIGHVPTSWHTLKFLHIQKLVQHWQQLKIKPVTIMRYMTAIRIFLGSLDCQVVDIDNQSLCLTRQYKRRKKTSIKLDAWQTMIEPSAQFIMGLQTQFGLTFSEAIRFIPDIHLREHSLWITRDIAFNSEDRVIPLRNDTQKRIITNLTTHTTGRKNLMQLRGYDTIRYQWRQSLSEHKLPTNNSYRYLYAQQLKNELSPVLGDYQVNWLNLIIMLIKSTDAVICQHITKPSIKWIFPSVPIHSSIYHSKPNYYLAYVVKSR